MKVRLKLLAYLVLALSLIMIGLPIHAADSSGQKDNIGALEISESDCPFHQTSTPEPQTSSMQTGTFLNDCCGPDCRCACASMSMLAIQRFQSPLIPLPAILPHSADSLFAAFYSSRRLRPPQA